MTVSAPISLFTRRPPAAAAAVFAPAFSHAVHREEKERIAVIFGDENTRLDAARAERWFRQSGYKTVHLNAQEDDAFFWLSMLNEQRHGVEICCGRTIPPEPWLTDRIARLMVHLAREGCLPILPATCIALNPVLSRLAGLGHRFAGVATFEEISRQASSLNRAFPVMAVVKDERARDAFLRRFTFAAVVLPAAPEPDFAGRFLHHVLEKDGGQGDGRRRGLVLFSPKRQGATQDFYSGLVGFYQGFFDPDFILAELKGCLARTEAGVLRRLKGGMGEPGGEQKTESKEGQKKEPGEEPGEPPEEEEVIPLPPPRARERMFA